MLHIVLDFSANLQKMVSDITPEVSLQSLVRTFVAVD